MKRFLKYLFIIIVSIVSIVSITYSLMNIIPGGPFLSDRSLSSEVEKAINEKYGLDKPLINQIINWIFDFCRGNMGVSLKIHRNMMVSDILLEYCMPSLCIGTIAIIFSIFLGIIFGILSAVNNGNVTDRIIQFIISLITSIPCYSIAIICLIFLSRFNLIPSIGASGLRNYIVPGIIQGLYPLCYIAKYMRSSMIESLNSHYIKTLNFAGVSKFKIIYKYCVKNSLIPVISYIGSLSASILLGSFIIETVFNIPGLGKCYIQSIINQDYPIVMAITVFYGIFLMIMNLLVEILHSAADPRIRTQNRMG